MSGMEHLIPIINQLQNVFTAVGSAPIALPQLVVVGSQSSGKSSVLEHIVGRDFLPRGTGIVTRRPLILQLTHTGSADDDDEDEDEEEEGEETAVEQAQVPQPEEGTRGARQDEKEGRKKSSAAAAAAAASPAAAKRAASSSHRSASPPATASRRGPSVNNLEEWGEFLHLPGRKFFNFDEIRREIVAETDRVTGGASGKAISAHPINLQIFSPHVLNLTMVDLPGITKVAVADQPADIEQQITNMIVSYISSPHALIIAVSQANADLANSDSLKLAREVDPSGIRTLGVLTKIDLMDRGTDAMQVLIGNAFELQHGFVGVVCRSQEDIVQGKSIRDALASEKHFFVAHPVYRSIASRLGTPFLARKLNSLLMMQIQSSLPDIRNKISSTIQETTAELDSYGSRQDAAEKGSILLPLISNYCSNLNDALDGRSPEVSLNELYGGARISYIFREIFSATLDSINPLDLLSDHDIRINIRNASGTRPALFIPEIAFELLVKKQIERLLSPALDCVELVFHELQRVALQCELLSPELIRFPHLRTRLLHVFQRLLKSCVEPTKVHIERLIQCELSFINTSHQDFIGGSAAVALIMERIQAKMKKASGGGGGGTNSSGATTGAAGVPTADGNSTAADPNHALLIQGFTGMSVNKDGSNNRGAHARTSSTHAPVSNNNAAATRHGGNNQSGWGFPSLFGRSPSPSSGSKYVAAQQQQQQQPGSSREGFSKRATDSSHGAPDHSGHHAMDGMVDHELYSGSTSSAHAKGAASAASPSPSVLSSSGVLLPPSSVSSSAPWHLKSLEPSERELIETEVIKILMESYFRIVRKSVADQVPKAIICFLVMRMRKELQAELVRELYQQHLLEHLLREADDIAEKRESCKELLVILQRAMAILNQARDFNAMATA